MTFNPPVTMPHDVHKLAMSISESIGKKSLFIRYTDCKCVETSRVVTPLAMMLRRDNVGVLAFCHLRDECRWFRADRIAFVDPVKLRAVDLRSLVLGVAAMDRHAQEAIVAGEKWHKEEGSAHPWFRNDDPYHAYKQTISHVCGK